MQFYILMIDYGKSYPGKKGPSGFEAVVQPEQTRRSIVEQARDIISEGRHSIAFIKRMDGNFCEDVTADIVEEASQMEAA